MTKKLDQCFVITNGSGEVIDPLERVFFSKSEARRYMIQHWDKTTRDEMNITIENLKEVLGL